MVTVGEPPAGGGAGVRIPQRIGFRYGSGILSTDCDRRAAGSRSKSAVASELLKSAAGPVAYLEGDQFWRFIVKSKPGEDDAGDGRMQNGRIVVRATSRRRCGYALGGATRLIWISPSAPWHPQAIAAAVKETPLHYVLLCPSEAVCAGRAAQRSEGAIPDYTRFKEMHQAFSNIGPFERHAIRDDHADPAGLASRIRYGLDRGTYRVAIEA